MNEHEHTVGDCPVCGRRNVELTIKPPIRWDHPQHM
jgi:hypothetical protein